MKIFIKKTQKGTAIAYALVIIAVVAILLTSIIGFVVSQIKYAIAVEAKEQSFQIAEAGIYTYRWYLAHETDGKSEAEIQAFWDNVSTPPRGLIGVATPWKEDFMLDGEKIGEYSVTVDKPLNSSSYAIITSEGYTSKMPNLKRTIKVRMRRSTWTDYAVLTDEPGRFDEKWDINGKVMSNKGIHFDGVARNVVYSGVNSFTDPDEGTVKDGVWSAQPIGGDGVPYNNLLGENVFLAGTKFPVVQKDFVGVALSFDTIKTYARTGTPDDNCSATGCYFTNQDMGRYIVLKSDGTFDISIVETIKNGNDIKKIKSGSLQNFTIPNNGVIYVEGDIWIEGTLTNKRLSVVSGGVAGKILIGLADLVYGVKNQQTVLGLISKTNIEIVTTGPDDVKINAAMLAQSGAVLKKDYNPNCCGGGCENNKNKIDIFGSIASKQRIEFSISKLCNSAKSVGFSTKKLEYDNNLYYYPPPFFPSEVYYSIDQWEEL